MPGLPARIGMSPLGFGDVLVDRAVIVGQSAMFKIRDDQLVVLAEALERNLVERIGSALREYRCRGTHALDDDTLRRRVVAGLTKARRHGFVTEREATFFVGMMFGVSPEFDANPAIMGLLSVRGNGPGGSLQLFASMVPPAVWAKAWVNDPEPGWARVVGSTQVALSLDAPTRPRVGAPPRDTTTTRRRVDEEGH